MPDTARTSAEFRQPIGKTEYIVSLHFAEVRQENLEDKILRAQSRTSGIPIIMATAKGTEYDKVIGLDSGADDYLAKPFGMMELISRVKAVLRRTEPKNTTDILQIGNLVLNRSTHTVLADGNKVVLTLKEYELLSTFMSNIGYVFSREQLLGEVWGADFTGETRTVDVHIGTLRTKLGFCGDYIHTVRGVGYKMEEEISGTRDLSFPVSY